MEISILIVTRKWNQDVQVFSHLHELEHKNIDFEILLAEGNNPSSQRNQLASQALGEYILFLDEDSVPVKDLLEHYYTTLVEHPGTQILGGPSVLRTTKPDFLNQLSQVFFSSFFGIGPVRSRYNSLGAIRKATERELILCNLLMKRDFFLKTNGFNQNLYPGEENEFLKRYHSNTGIMHNPNAIVFRGPRETFLLFLEQIFSYGKGRSKHFIWSSRFEYIFLIPLIFTLYIFSLPFVLVASIWFTSPIFLHLIFSAVVIFNCKVVRLSFLQKLVLPVFFFSGHLIYGLGLLWGFLNYKILKKLTIGPKKRLQIKIHKLKNFKKLTT